MVSIHVFHRALSARRELGVILGVQWVRTPGEDESIRVRHAKRDQLFVSLAVGDDYVLPGIRSRFPDAVFIHARREKEGFEGEKRLMKRTRWSEPSTEEIDEAHFCV